MKQIAIIGGGAAGLVAAITAAHQIRNSKNNANTHDKDVRVVVYEKDDRVGRSILATGNGRCNFSNVFPDQALYHNRHFVADAFMHLDAQTNRGLLPLCADVQLNPVLAFFRNLGLEWREESEGRLYPMANKATSVLDVLRTAAVVLGVQECCDCQVVRVDAPERTDERFHIRFADDRVQHADAVIVAIGGKASAQLLPSTIPAKEMQPVLVPLALRGSDMKALDNIRVRAAVELPYRSVREVGEVLFRKYGVSGIAVFNLSRYAQPGDVLRIDLLPQVRELDCVSYLFARRKRLAKLVGSAEVTGELFFQGLLLPQVARLVMQRAGVHPSRCLEKHQIPVLAEVLKHLDFVVEGVGDAKQCQVHRGGVCVDAVCPETMQLRTLPGLYMVGEALDVDAPCGGYNLHWAWASGMLAGSSAARLVTGE